MNKSNIILSYIISKSLFFGLGISYIISNSTNNSLSAIIIGYIIGSIILYIIKKKNIYNKLLIFLLTTIIFIIILLSFTVQTINFYLPHSPSLIIAISFILVTIYGANKNINSYKRLNELLIFISLALTLIGIIGNINNIDISNIKPLFYELNINFIKSIFAVIILSITPNILLLNIDNNISQKELLIGYYLSGINILLLVISTIGTLGITLAKSYRYPEYIAFEKISFMGFIERIENILAFIWLIDLLSLGILCLINIYKIINKKISIIIIIIITYLTVNIFINIYQNTMIIYHYIFYILAIIIILLLIKKR